MSVVRVGATKKFSDNWDKIFAGGGSKSKSAKSAKAAKPAKASAKKKTAKKKAAPKGAKKASRGK